MRRIIDAGDGVDRADAVGVAREHGRGWSDITIALALSREPDLPL